MIEHVGYIENIDAPAPIEEVRARIDRILRGEDISQPTVEAGEIPPYYGCDTTEQACALWLRMYESMKPRDEWFYLSNAIGWASR